MRGACRKATGKVVKVPGIPDQFYAGWRARFLQTVALHESFQVSPRNGFSKPCGSINACRRETLTTLDGRAVRILHPGFWNHEAGPDFRDALIQFDHDFPLPAMWKSTCSPPVGTVMVTNGTPLIPASSCMSSGMPFSPTRAAPPTLALKSCLDSPLEELRHWLGVDATLPEHLAGRCLPPLRDLSDG
jgi:hypothetical protein